MTQFYSRLKLIVPDRFKSTEFTYKFKVYSYINKKKDREFSGQFDSKGFSKWYSIHERNATLIYEIYLRGELLQKISAKAYPERTKHSVYKLKFTRAMTEKAETNIKEIYLNDEQVAWYLVKQKETLLDLTKRIYEKPLLSKDWEILKANNSHLGPIINFTLLRPGQVLILSEKSTGKELEEYKAQAKQAQRNLEKMTAQDDFDSQFFAQNYEFFYDASSDIRTKMLNTNIFENNNHPLIYEFNNSSANDSNSAWGAIAKGGLDGALGFSEGVAQKMNKVHGELALKMAEERARGSALANPKNFKAFRKKYASLYAELDRESTKRIFLWDQSIKTHNMRRIINQSSLARGATYKGGIKEYVKKMSELGKMSKSIKGGGYLFLALDVYNAGDAIANAKSGEKMRTAVVEGSKIVGGMGGAAIGAFIVLTVASGGTSLIVLGVAAGFSALLGIGGSEVGEIIGNKAYDFFD